MQNPSLFAPCKLFFIRIFYNTISCFVVKCKFPNRDFFKRHKFKRTYNSHVNAYRSQYVSRAIISTRIEIHKSLAENITIILW